MTELVWVGWAALLLMLGVLPVILLDAVLRPSRIGGWIAGLREQHGRGGRIAASGPPIEQLGVQLRRLSAVLTDPRPVSAVRRFGVERAYDELLAKACLALGVEHSLSERTAHDQAFERLRVEAVLQAAGLVIRGPVGADRSGRDGPGQSRHERRWRDGRG